MTKPEAGPVAATKEGSDCDNPANSPLLFPFSFSSGSYTMAKIYSHCAFLLILLRVIRGCTPSPSTSCVRCESSNGGMFQKAFHFTPQPQLFYSVFFPFRTYNVHNSYVIHFQGIKTAGAVGGHVRMPVVITQSVRAQGKNRNAVEYVTFGGSVRKKASCSCK